MTRPATPSFPRSDLGKAGSRGCPRRWLSATTRQRPATAGSACSASSTSTYVRTARTRRELLVALPMPPSAGQIDLRQTADREIYFSHRVLTGEGLGLCQRYT